jgi:hypothetical protein
MVPELSTEHNRKRLRKFGVPFWVTEQTRLMYRVPGKYIHIAKCEQLLTAEWWFASSKIMQE